MLYQLEAEAQKLGISPQAFLENYLHENLTPVCSTLNKAEFSFRQKTKNARNPYAFGQGKCQNKR
jgi:hypothetical protein